MLGNKPELLVPAGSMENLKIAVKYGADAVYIGGEQFGLRAKAKNFTIDDMKEAVRYAHQYGVKVFVTANIIAHNADLDGVEAYFEELKEVNPDALIIADPGILAIAKTVLPDMELHLSTQANNTNFASINFWYNQGVQRVVVARELSLEEIGTIRSKIPTDMDIEAFVHGAMCISYSGRCLLSNYMTGNDANHGACNHPCRWNYHLVEETRPGEYMPVVENERGTYIYNSKDLCMIHHVDDLVKAGITSFKIEGRMKTALYVATVTRAYRQAIDDYFENPDLYHEKREQYLEEVMKCSYRHFYTGFYYNKPDDEGQIYDSNSYIRDYTFVGKVLEDSVQEASGLWKTLVEQRYKFVVGDTIELMGTAGDTLSFEVAEIVDEEGNHQESAPHPKQKVYIQLPRQARMNEILRKRNK
jgi:putative protease